ncbi:MAG: phage holin family protein [Actinobacteria bacterium]|nr:phage holin family protein [Actinomycetota bacterium]
MPTRTTDRGNGGLGGAVKQVAEHASGIARLEVELAALELKQKVAALGIGIGLAVGGAVFGLFMLGFGLATIAAVLDTFLSTWLALLIVTVALGVLAGLLVLLGLGKIRKGSPPVPEQAIREAKLTTGALKS